MKKKKKNDRRVRTLTLIRSGKNYNFDNHSLTQIIEFIPPFSFFTRNHIFCKNLNIEISQKKQMFLLLLNFREFPKNL